MQTISPSVVSNLLKSNGPCLSLYLATDRATETSQQHRIRYKHLLREAEESLQSWNADPLLALAAPLYENDNFWNEPGDGVAAFARADSFHAFRLPMTCEMGVYVGARPYIRPLLPFLAEDSTYHLLAVSENAARLFRGMRYELEEIKLATLPEKQSDVLSEHTESQMLVHTGQPALPGKEGRVFYGEGGVDVQKINLDKYFREIDQALTPYLRDHGEEGPLVFCGVEYLFPHYRKVATYAHLYDTPITGNFDRATATELLERANEVLTPYWTKQREQDRQRLENCLGSPRVSTDIDSIVPAACDGKVAVLFLASSARIDGRYDPQTRRCALGSESHESEDLLNLAAIETLLHRGRVYAVQAQELPAGDAASALYRYS